MANLNSFKAAAGRLILSCVCLATACLAMALPVHAQNAVNQATIAAPAGVTDPTPGNNSATDSDTIVRTADLSITKTDGAASVQAGGTTIYTVVVTNAGPSSVAGASVVDTAPAGLTITSWSCAITTAGTGGGTTACGSANGTGNINTTADLRSGGVVTYTVNATIDGTASGSIANTATVSAPTGTTDPTAGNNTATDTNTVARQADLAITKTDGVTSVQAGGTTSYTVVVSNAGLSAVAGATVVDTAPAGLTITSWSCAITTAGTGAGNTACGSASGTGNINTTVDLRNGGAVTYTVNAAVDGTATGSIANTATVAAPANTSDPTAGNNTATDTNTVTRQANLSVTKTDGVTSVPPGGSTTYTIVVSNAGPSAVAGATVVDTAPAGLTITNWTCAVTTAGTGGGNTACGSAGGTGNINTTADLRNGGAVTYVVNATVAASATGSITNTVTVTSPPGTPDPGPDGNTASDTNTVPRTADIAVQKTLTTPAPYAIGQAVSYSIVVTNNGPSQALNVGVTDTPSNLTITGVSGACTTFPCTIASINSGTSVTITVNGTVGSTPGTFNNTATATVPANTTDPTPGNNTDDAPATAVESADVSIVKTLTTPGPYFVGQTITYTLAVANAGPSTATSVQVTDTPTNLTIQSVSGACTALPCTIASLASGANASITVTATFVATGAFDNSASANATQSDPNPANNTDNSGNGGNAGASADVSVVKTLTTAGPYTIGQVVSFNIVVSNAGPSTATAVQVTDTPTNLTLGTVSGACTALPCSIASIASGASATIAVTGTIVAEGAFSNSATATPAESDPNTGNNTGTGGGNTTPTADVSVVKTLTTAGPYTIGQTVSFNIVVSNAGPSTATAVQVTDTPTNLTLGTVSGACTALPCSIASIASGASATITVTGTIIAEGAFSNSATATPTQNDPNTGNNTGTGGGNTTPTADVSVVKTLTTAGPYTIGQTVSFNIVVSNAGPSTATAVQVTDTPTNLTLGTVSGACTALPCSIASIASGASATIAVTGTIVAEGAFSNSATATPAESDPNTGNNTGTGGGNTTPTADVSVVKTLTTAGPYIIGQTVSFDIVVSNAGPSVATNIAVTDTPTNLTLGTVTGACTALPCSIASIASGASATITVTGTIVADGAFSNSATATPTQNDPNTGNNTGTGGGNTTPTADVSVVKTLTTAGPYTIGQTVSFNIVVSNAGPSVATNIAVTDTPTNLTLGTVSGACTALPCSIASIASGASATIAVTGTIVAEGAFSNSATATPAESDPNTGNNTGTGGGNTTPTADVSVVKTLTTAGPYIIGQTVSFNIVVSNAGPSVATNIAVTDAPTNLTLGTVTGACTALPCSIASIASGASATITVTGTILADGAFSNSATATPAESDPNTGNNTGTGGGNTTPTADVSVVKTLTTAGPYIIGQTVSFNIVVSNAGPSVATNIAVTDTPTNLTLGTVSGACTALPCSIASIASGASATITVTGTILADGAFSNSATATPAESDPNAGNNTGTGGGNTTPTADVSVVKTLTTAGPYIIGQTVSFDIVVSNAGPSTATNIAVTDTPTNLTLGTVSGACTALPCSIASIASGASATITVTGTILADGAFSNSATATPAESDPNAGNNTGTGGGNTTPTADVSVVKTLTTPAPYLAGQAVQYSIVVTNAGPSAATNVQVTDTPTNIAISGVSGAGCSALPCTIASLASGASTTITVDATIGATGGAFNNSATATGSETDPNAGNNTDDASATASALPIVANPDSATTPQNTSVTVSVLGNDTLNGVPANPTTVTVTQASPPANGSIVVNPDGTIAYTPAPGFSGTDTYSYQICEIANPANCATATVTVTVQPNVVTAVDDSASTPGNTPVTISPLANDTATGAPLNPASVTITAQPAHGTVTVNPDGTVVYTPAANYLGSDTFTYQVCDTSTPTAICDTAVVTVTVTGSPPVTGAAGDQGSGPTGQPVTIPVLANDSDPDGNLDPTTVVIVGAPGNGKSLVVPGQGTWTVNPDGTITFTPEPGFAGQATPIQYTVSDTTGLVSNPSTVNVTILGDVQLRVSKIASPRDVKIGDLVRYTVTIENVGVANAVDATLVDTPPAGFSYVADSLTAVDGNGGGRLAGTYPIRVDQLDIAIGERATVTYLLRVGAGVRPGIHTNHAFVQDNGVNVSNEATADVQLVADPLLDESLLIGTVFDDRDGDGWQDRATLDGVRVQGGFAPGAYVAGSTLVDRGDGAKPEPDASAPLLHGLDLGSVAGRASDAEPASAHAIVISQLLRTLDFTDDFALTSKQGVTLRMDAAGNSRVERSGGDAAKGLTGAEPKVERRVSQMQDGYRVDYVVSNLGVDERGIPGVRIASVEGLLIETDQYGRYHLEGVAGGPWERGRNFILKVDPATLPPGSAFTTDNPLVRRITPGVPVRFDFGVKLPSGLIEGGKQDVEMTLGEVMFDAGSAQLRQEHLPVIEKMAEQVRAHDGGEIVIAANGDTQALAYDRARAVQDALAKALTPEQMGAVKVSLRADVEDPHSALASVGASTLLGTVLFDTDKADIRAEYLPLIEAIAADIGKRGGGTVGVVGHADQRGSDAYNVQLGLRRAKAVYEAIAAKLSPPARAKLRVEISDNPTAPVGIRGQ